MAGPIRLMVFQGYRTGYGSFGALMRPLLQRGSRGDAVVEAQNALMNVLQRSLRDGADGVFGADTERAVREAQSRYGLAVDGVIGKDTWTLLLGQPVEISGNVPRQEDTAQPDIPGTTGPGTGTPRNDGDIVVREPPGTAANKSNTMMIVGGIAAAGVLAYLLLGRKK